MRFRLTLEYAGTRYSGWQIQPNARTVQGEFIRAIADVLRTRVFELYGAGRTDAGVHASGQVAHLETRARLSPEPFRRRVNEALPADISLLQVDRAHPKFHARHDAVARRYVYQIARRRTAFAKPFVWWVKEPLDLGRMRVAAAAFKGLHDFATFADRRTVEPETKVLVERLKLVEDGDLVLVVVQGSHFLWRMVRRLVGVLAEVGRNGLEASEVPSLLKNHSDLPAQLTAPASGLFLDRVFYPGEPRDAPLHTPIVLRPALPAQPRT